jgi:hypothetical protein
MLKKVEKQIVNTQLESDEDDDEQDSMNNFSKFTKRLKTFFW